MSHYKVDKPVAYTRFRLDPEYRREPLDYVSMRFGGSETSEVYEGGDFQENWNGSVSVSTGSRGVESHSAYDIFPRRR